MENHCLLLFIHVPQYLMHPTPMASSSIWLCPWLETTEDAFVNSEIISKQGLCLSGATLIDIEHHKNWERDV
jgi:hypothetical protein